jgi:hypothetical protein
MCAFLLGIGKVFILLHSNNSLRDLIFRHTWAPFHTKDRTRNAPEPFIGGEEKQKAEP